METTNAPAAPAPAAPLRGRGVLALLAIAAVVGLVAALAAWSFLELAFQLQHGIYDELPEAVGFDGGAPDWWCLPALAIGGLLVAVAVRRLPGNGGHVPAYGLSTQRAEPRVLPGVLLAALATLGCGAVLGPEAPLIALGGGIGVLALRLARPDAPPQAVELVAAAGTFSAMALIFESPLIAAVILIEAAGLGGPQLRAVIVPGMLAAGTGSLISIGMGSWTGLSTSDYALPTLELATAGAPTVADFGWSIGLGAAVAAGCVAVVAAGRRVAPIAARRPYATIPLAGLAIGGLAIAFAAITDHGVEEVLFDGQDALEPLVADASTWSIGALAAVLALKGAAWALALGAFRGGPTFPAIFLGAAAGVLASHLPGFDLAAALGVGIGAAVVAVLGLPLSAVVLAVLLTATAGPSLSPIVIVGVVAAYLTTTALGRLGSRGRDAAEAAPRPVTNG